MQDQPIRLIRLKEVMAMTGLSRSYVYQLIGKGYFPQSISLGARAVAWVQSEVQQWIDSRVEQARQRA
ncbi:helix-turn-helix transcriptional regulator [Vibrio fluvialis]|uniref:helix-turn-helix transcriptional regulator n=1 Tax=Vibrio fluvialis TaxID=676 RepID=UPI003BA090FD